MDSKEINNDDSEIGRLGGVKALLKQINNKYSDSHVQLPDGTVPNPKIKPHISRAKKKGAESEGKNTEDKTENDSNQALADGNGVKAMLKEINTKFSNSFVQLPDGSVPTKQASNPKASRGDHEEADLATEIPHIQEDPVIIPDNLADELQVSYSNNEGSRPVLDDSNALSDYPTNSTMSSASTQPSYVGEPPKLLSDYPEPHAQTFRVHMQVRTAPIMSNHASATAVPRSNFQLNHGNPPIPNGYGGSGASAQAARSVQRAQVPASSLTAHTAHDQPLDPMQRHMANGMPHGHFPQGHAQQLQMSQGHTQQAHMSQGHVSQSHTHHALNRSAYSRIQHGDPSSMGMLEPYQGPNNPYRSENVHSDYEYIMNGTENLMRVRQGRRDTSLAYETPSNNNTRYDQYNTTPSAMPPRKASAPAMAEAKQEHALPLSEVSQPVLPSLPSTIRSDKMRCGIGVNFKRLPSGCFEVVSLVPGGAGEESGLVFVGDVLRYVDGADVTHSTPEQLHELLLGSEGSNVTLSFGKPGDEYDDSLVHVAITRGLASASSETSAPMQPTSPAVPRVLVPKVIQAKPLHVSGRWNGQQEGEGLYDSSGGNSHSSYKWEKPFSDSSTADEDKQVGVGIVFYTDEVGGLRVKKLAPGGPAEEAGGIYPGDVLFEVDGIDVYKLAISEVQGLVVGPLNTSVVLGLREEHNMDYPLRKIKLTRRWSMGQNAENQVLGIRNWRQDIMEHLLIKITDTLFIGTYETAKQREVLRENGIDCILNVAAECENYFETEFNYTRMPFEDKENEYIRRGFDDAAEIIFKYSVLGFTIMIHCTANRSRSSTICIAYLMKKKGLSLRRAWETLKNLDINLSWNRNFFLQLVQYELEIYGTNSLVAEDFELLRLQR